MGRMAEHSTEFTGLAALITGGASGIGLASARLLAGRGARVAVLDRVKPEAGDEGVYPVLADVTDDAAVRAAVAQAGRALGGLDILVNNAGIGAAGTVEDNDDDEWHRVLDVNVLGIVRTTRAALPLLRQAARERGQAAIVNTCSIAGTAGLPQRALYCASKGAVYALTLAMAADHVAEGIRVNCVNPGTVDTPWVAAARRRARPGGRTAALSRAPAHGPPGYGGRGGRGHRLPGQPARRRYHGHRARGRRRHERPAHQAPGGLTQARRPGNHQAGMSWNKGRSEEYVIQ